MQRALFKLSGTEIPVKPLFDGEEDSTAVYERVDSNFRAIVPFIEETVERWNSRTQILKMGHKSNAAA